MPYAVVIDLNGRTIVLSVHPTFEAAQAVADASPFVDAQVRGPVRI